MAKRARKATDWNVKTGFRWSKKLSDDGLFPKLNARLNEAVSSHLRQLMPEIFRILTKRIKTGRVAKQGLLQQLPAYSRTYARLLRRAGMSDRPDLTLRGGLLDHLSARVAEKDGAVIAGLYPYGSTDGRSKQWLWQKVREREGTYAGSGKKTILPYTYQRNGKLVSVPARETEDKRTKGAGQAITYQALANELAGRYGFGRWTGGGKSDQGEKAPGRFLTLSAEETSAIEQQLAGKGRALLESMLRAALK